MDNKDSAQKAHRAEAGAKMSPIGKRLFKYVEFDQNEDLLCEIHKHPIGALGLAIAGAGITSLFLVGSIVLVTKLDALNLGITDDTGSLKLIILIAGFTLSLISLIIMVVSVILYRLNVVYVTNEKIAEVSYEGIFSRKVTQLGNGNIEDVTAHQKGILARIFNYGTMIIETASERENLTFTMVPKPNYCSQIVIQAHETYNDKQAN